MRNFVLRLLSDHVRLEKLEMIQKTFLKLVLPLSAVLIFAGEAYAKTRHCRAYYQLEYVALDGQSVLDVISSTRIGQFSAAGHCRRADNCRRNARELAHQCMTDHWNNKAIPRKPTSCQHSDVEKYPITDLEDAIRQVASNQWQGSRNATVRVLAVTIKSGPKTNNICNRTTILSDQHYVDFRN